MQAGSQRDRRQRDRAFKDSPGRGFVPVRVLSDVNFGGQLTMTAELRGGTRLTIPLAGPEMLQLAIAALVGADAERVGDRPC